MVESTALEMRRAGNGTVGSNPTLSATDRESYLQSVWGNHDRTVRGPSNLICAKAQAGDPPCRCDQALGRFARHLVPTANQAMQNSRIALRQGADAYRRDVAMHAKLDELLIASGHARDEMAAIEDSRRSRLRRSPSASLTTTEIR